MYIPTGVVQRAPLDLGAGEALELTVFVDGYLVEVLLNNRTAITALVAPNANATGPEDRRNMVVNSAGVAATVDSWQIAL